MKSCPTLLLIISVGHQFTSSFADSLRGLTTRLSSPIATDGADGVFFQIKSTKKELCLTVSSNEEDVELRECDDELIFEQQWFYQEFTLVNAGTNLCLDYDISNNEVGMWKCHGRKNQMWTNDYNKIRTVAFDRDNICLAVTGKKSIMVDDCEDKPEQEFEGVPIILNVGGALIVQSDKCTSVDDESNVEMKICDGVPLDGAQRWDVLIDEEGPVRNFDSGECLDVVDLNKDEPPMNVITWKCNGKNNQQWEYNSDDRAFEIRSRSNVKYCLKAQHFGNLEAYTCNNAPAQKFDIFSERADPVNVTYAPIRFGGEKDFVAHGCVEMGLGGKYNVFITKCKENKESQQWFAKGDSKEIINKQKVDGEWYCLDVRQSDLNLIAWPCHGSQNKRTRSNQQFLWDNTDRIRSETELGCVSINFRNKNMHLMSCHGGDNQKFFWY